MNYNQERVLDGRWDKFQRLESESKSSFQNFRTLEPKLSFDERWSSLILQKQLAKELRKVKKHLDESERLLNLLKKNAERRTKKDAQEERGTSD